MAFEAYQAVVKPEWIDLNGHLNLAYYGVMFDEALDRICVEWDLDWAYTKRENAGMFAVETHTLYRQELAEGERVTVRTWVIGVDAKRLHVAHELYRLPDRALSACWEAMMLHVDLGTRKVTPWPDRQRGLIEATMAAQTTRPDWTGRRIALPTATA